MIKKIIKRGRPSTGAIWPRNMTVKKFASCFGCKKSVAEETMMILADRGI